MPITSLSNMFRVTTANIDKFDLDKSEMYNTITNFEQRFQGQASYALVYWLGFALYGYASWFIRGDERKPYFLRATANLEKAYKLSDGKVTPSRKDPFDAYYVDMNRIGGELCKCW